MQRLSSVFLLAATLVGLHSGCRRAEDTTAAIAAKGSVVIDRGLLNDPTAYTPANYPGASSSSGGGGESSSGTEDPAIRSAVRDSLMAIVDRNVAGVFAALDETQIEALLKPLPPDDKSVKDALIESVEKGEAMVRLMCEKSANKAECDATWELIYTLSKRAVEAATDAIKVEMLSPDAASAGIDPERLRSNLVAALNDSRAELNQMFTQAAAQASAQGAPNPLEGQSPESLIAMLESAPIGELPPGVGLPLRRVDGNWKIDIPMPITDEHATIASEGLALGKQFMDKVMEKLQGEASVDQAGLQMMFMEVMGEMMPQFMELQAKAEALAGGQPEPGAEEPAPDATGDTVSDTPNPRMRDPRRP